MNWALLSSCFTGFCLDNRGEAKTTSLLLIFTFLTLSYSLVSYPQAKELPFENIPIEEGIPTIVQSIYQDRVGYLWFATWSGLYKYDGYNFTSYKNEIENNTSLFDNTLSTICEDKEGIFWIGSKLGLERFDPKSETFLHYSPNPIDSSDDLGNQIKAIHEDKNGMLWIGSGNGLYKFDRKLKEFSTVALKPNEKSNLARISVQSFYEDSRGNLWIGTDRGLYKFDLNTSNLDTTTTFTSDKYRQFSEENRKLLSYWSLPSVDYKPENINATQQINSIFGEETGIIWLGTNDGLVEFNPQTSTFTNYLFNYNLPLNRISSLCRDVITGSIWLATIDGLYSFNKNYKAFTKYNSLANCVFAERSGSFWIGTNAEIKKLNRSKQPFRKYILNESAQAVSNGKYGIVWIFTFNGWLKFDVNRDQFVPYSFGENILWYIWPNDASYSLRGEKIGLQVKDSLDNLVFSLDPSQYDYVNSSSIGINFSDEYWGGSINGDIDLWDYKTNRFKTLKNFKRRISWIHKDSFGLYWISCFKGNLYCYDRTADTCKEFIYDPRSEKGLSGNIVFRIFEDSKGRLWFPTNNGLNRFNRSTNTFTYYGTKDGFSTNNTLTLLEDDKGYLWINTTKGVTKFNPETKSVRNYDASYSVEPALDGTVGNGCKTRNGEMFFPGAKGFTRFHPDSVKDNPFIPPIVITSFKKFDKPSPIEKEIRLPYDENFLSFEFAALSYLSQERNQYAYMMEGLDKDWINAGTRRYASYPNLDPGEYVFRVKGSNNDGIWNEAGTSILIKISPPWWKTAWAYILYSLLILSAVYTIWKMQLKRMKISHEFEMTKFEAQKLHEVDEIKSRFFTNISHEFRTPLTLILGPAKQLIGKINDEKVKTELKVIHKNANRLLGLVNQLLDISKLESSKMKLQTVPQNIVSLMKALTLSFTSYAERKRIELKFNSSEDEIITYIDKDKIEKIITNVLSNAFKFTPDGGRIEVTVQPTPRPSQGGDETFSKVPYTGGDLRVGKKGISTVNYVEIAIKDTGVGIPKEKLSKIFDRFYQVDGSHTREQEGTGIGLSLTKELVELHKGTIEVESEAGKGTTVRILLPLGKEHLMPEEITGEELEFEKEYEKEELIVDVGENVQREKKEKVGFEEKEKESLPLLLLVEDNADVRNYIRSNLNKEFKIIEAVDGEGGWNNTLEHMPDLIVSDIMMPKMDGFELCKKLKTDERTSHIPLILLTAKAATSDKIEGYEIGADDYIMKPFEPYELKARIKNLIEQRKRLHEHFKKHGLFNIDEKNVTPVDQKFLKKIFETINQHISDSSFSVESLVENLSLSRSVLHRKVVSLLGETPADLIRRIRLAKAADLIKQDFGNLSEIALEVGFSNPAHFSESFKKQYGVPPSQFK